MVTTALGARPSDNKTWETVTTTAGNRHLERWSYGRPGDSYPWESHYG
jgi:hypothetical protein